MARKRIVIVEDSRVIASVYRAKLQAEGYDIQVAADGESGLALVNELSPDLVVLDLCLPRMSGVEVLVNLRRQTRFEGLPIYVLSGTYSGAVVEQAWAAGATGVLSKATEAPNHVVQVIRSALEAA